MMHEDEAYKSNPEVHHYLNPLKVQKNGVWVHNPTMQKHISGIVVFVLVDENK